MLSARHKLLCDSNQHIKYIRGASSQSQLQSRNDHLSSRVTVMETQPVPPLKIVDRAAFPSPSATQFRFGSKSGPLIAHGWDYRLIGLHLGELNFPGGVGNQNLYLLVIVWNLLLCDDTQMSTPPNALLLVRLFILWDIFKLLLQERKIKSESSNTDRFGPERSGSFI